MHKHADITFENENKTFFVSGNLTFFNVMSVYEKSLLHLKETSFLHFDFSKLQSSDSAGLALIIEWMKLANESHKDIQFSHLPQNILTIAKAAGLHHLIAL